VNSTLILEDPKEYDSERNGEKAGNILPGNFLSNHSNLARNLNTSHNLSTSHNLNMPLQMEKNENDLNKVD